MGHHGTDEKTRVGRCGRGCEVIARWEEEEACEMGARRGIGSVRRGEGRGNQGEGSGREQGGQIYGWGR